jgi:uncharacterized membrane protein YgdD (TMEM256/DUF423 family)
VGYNAWMNFPRYKLWLLVGAISGLLAVALGAFGAHGLKSHFEKQGYEGVALLSKLAPWETAAHYQLAHAVTLLAIGFVAQRRCGRAINLAGTAMTLGTLLFSGCLYGWLLSESIWLVRLVPVGGLLLIAGWACLAIAVWRLTDEPR